MAKKGAAFWAGGIAVTCVVIAIVLLVAHNGGTTPAVAESTSSYDQQMAVLDTAYERGRQASDKMRAHKIRPNDYRCSAMYRATVASELGNPEFEAEVEQFYVAGCMAPQPK
jgi:hypothetical protein